MRKTIAWMVSLIILSGAAALPAEPAGATIVVNLGSFKSARQATEARGEVDWSVHEAPDTIICTEALAALELQTCLAKMTGLTPADFPIIDDDNETTGTLILVGNAHSNKAVALKADGKIKLPDAPEQSYRILGDPESKTLILAGADRVGTLYAAYRYLDLLGVRWYGPGEINEEVPRLAKFEIAKLDISEKPGFVTRGFWAWEDRGTDEFIEWMGRNRMNFWTVEQHDTANCKMRGMKLTCGQHDIQAKFINPNDPYPYDVAEFKGDEGRAVDPYPRGDYQGDLNDDRRLSYREVHPEWYGMKKGMRQFDMHTDWGTNICDSNPSAVAEFAKNVVNALIDTDWKNADSINVWMMDGTDRWCECEECKKLGTLTDRNFRILYRFQQELKKARAEGRLKRDVTVQFLAYHELIDPPKAPLPADFDFDHCIATYFPILRCYAHAFNDPKCAEINRQYDAAYRGWSVDSNRLFKGPLFIGEYYNVSRFNHLPLVLDDIMRADIPYFYKTGARAFHYMHAPTANWGTRTLTQWQMARMLWDPNLNVDALLNDYYTGRYGPAADAMRKVHDCLRTAMSNAHVMRFPLQDALQNGAKPLFPTKHMRMEVSHPETDDGPDWVEILAAMKNARARMDQARAIGVPERIAARIAEDDRLLAYAENSVLLYDRAIAAQQALNNGDKAAARKALDESLPYQNKLKADKRSTKYGSSHVNSPDGLRGTRITGGLARMERAAGE